MITPTVIFCFFFSLENQKCLRKPFLHFFFHRQKIVSRPHFIVFSRLLAVVHGNVLRIFHGLIFFCFIGGNRIFPVLSVKIVKNAEFPEMLTDIFCFKGHFLKFFHGLFTGTFVILLTGGKKDTEKKIQICNNHKLRALFC